MIVNKVKIKVGLQWSKDIIDQTRGLGEERVVMRRFRRSTWTYLRRSRVGSFAKSRLMSFALSGNLVSNYSPNIE